MKILFIITRNDKGGSYEFLLKLIDFLKSETDVKLIYGGKKQYYNFDSSFIPSLIRDIGLFNDLIAFFNIFFEIINYKPDIIHTHTSKAGFLGRWAGFIYKVFSFKKVKIIHTPHGHVFYGYFKWFKTYLIIFLEKLTSYITDRFIALTENEKVETLNYGIGIDEKWIVIPSGIDYNFKLKGVNRKEVGIKEDDIVIGSVMRIEKIKGWEYLVRAADIVLKRKDNVRFIIVGDGNERFKLEYMIERYQIKEKFIITGWVDNVYDWISLMDIYVQPSLNEGLGMAVLMAELLSKPIIASSVCGLKDLVRDGYNGILFSVSDYLELSNSIMLLINNSELRRKMAKNSFYIVNEDVDGFKRYSFERALYLHKKLYGLIK